MTQDQLKKAAAWEALKFVEENTIVGVGTGSTVNHFIDALGSIKQKVAGAVSSSEASTEKLKALGIPVYDLNSVNDVSIYIDGADEIDHNFCMIKGGGAALTREKIVAAVAEKFVCIVDESKVVETLGTFPLPVEVIPMARSYVARQLLALGGDPVYRDGVKTDNGNIIIDVYNLSISNPLEWEEKINNIVGVVTNGVFAQKAAHSVIIGTPNGPVTKQQ